MRVTTNLTETSYRFYLLGVRREEFLKGVNHVVGLATDGGKQATLTVRRISKGGVVEDEQMELSSAAETGRSELLKKDWKGLWFIEVGAVPMVSARKGALEAVSHTVTVNRVGIFSGRILRYTFRRGQVGSERTLG